MSDDITSETYDEIDNETLEEINSEGAKDKSLSSLRPSANVVHFNEFIRRTLQHPLEICITMRDDIYRRYDRYEYLMEDIKKYINNKRNKQCFNIVLVADWAEDTRRFHLHGMIEYLVTNNCEICHNEGTCKYCDNLDNEIFRIRNYFSRRYGITTIKRIRLLKEYTEYMTGQYNKKHPKADIGLINRWNAFKYVDNFFSDYYIQHGISTEDL